MEDYEILALRSRFPTKKISDVDVRRGTSTYVDVRRRTSTYVYVRRRTSTYVDVRRRTSILSFFWPLAAPVVVTAPLRLGHRAESNSHGHSQSHNCSRCCVYGCGFRCGCLHPVRIRACTGDGMNFASFRENFESFFSFSMFFGCAGPQHA